MGISVPLVKTSRFETRLNELDLKSGFKISPRYPGTQSLVSNLENLHGDKLAYTELNKHESRHKFYCIDLTMGIQVH